MAKDLDTTDKQVTEAKGGITVLRWVLGAIGVGGLGAGAMVADGAEGADGDHGADVVRAVIEAADRP